MKAVLWIATLIFGSLLGVTAGLVCGAMFALGVSAGLDPATVAQRVNANVFTPAKAPLSQPQLKPRFETASAH